MDSERVLTIEGTELVERGRWNIQEMGSAWWSENSQNEQKGLPRDWMQVVPLCH